MTVFYVPEKNLNFLIALSVNNYSFVLLRLPIILDVIMLLSLVEILG